MSRRASGALMCLGFLVIALPLRAGASSEEAAIASRLGEEGEDLIDPLLASPRDQASITAQVAKMRADLALLSSRLRRGNEAGTRQEVTVSLVEYLLDEAERSAAGRDLPRAALAVNQLTLVLIPFQSWRTDKDRDVALLDYLGREVVLLNRLPKGTGSSTLKARRDEIAATWKRRRAGFAAIPKARATVTAMDRCVGELQTSESAAAQVAAGNRLLDLVDELEKL